MSTTCDDHAKMCGDMGAVNANITNLTIAISALSGQINALANPIYQQINGLKTELNEHKVDSVHFREKILTTEKVLQEYIKHQKEKEEAATEERKDAEAKLIQKMGVLITVISIIAQILIKVLFKC